MIKKQFVLIDKDIRYLERVQDYLVKKHLSDFQIIVYTSIEQAAIDSKKNSFEILVISESCYEEERIKELCAVHIYLLKESAKQLNSPYPAFAKYQSMEEILKEILTCYTREIGQGVLIKRGKRAKILSFYTKGSSLEQTLYALTAGQLLAKEQKKVLYLNMQPFCGLEELIKQRFLGDLTDVIYYGLQHSEKFGSRIDSCKLSFQEISVLPPIGDYADLLSLTKEEWQEWLAGMVYEAGYEVLIIDFSGLSLGTEVLFSDSDVIYEMEAGTDWEKACQKQLENWLDKKGLQESQKNRKELPHPKDIEVEAESLLYSSYGIYMKNRLIEDGFLKNEGKSI